MKKITAKLGRMRKEVSWVVYPKDQSQPNLVTIQSDKRICCIDLHTGQGMLSANQQNGAYILHLMTQLGAGEVDIPQYVIDEIQENQPQSGDKIDNDGMVWIA